MKRTVLVAVLAAGSILGGLLVHRTVRAGEPAPAQPCKSIGKAEACRLHGKVKFVTSFPDYKIQIVNSFPDAKVKKVTAFPDKPGEWKVVDSFPDFTVQVVDSFPDFKVQYVDSFPGCP